MNEPARKATKTMRIQVPHRCASKPTDQTCRTALGRVSHLRDDLLGHGIEATAAQFMEENT